MSGRRRKPEVLAPAGSAAALQAALAAGADAVYFGLQDGFNARARAANFALADLPATVAQIHRAGARAYVACNTLVFEPELPHVERLLRSLAAAGVDALIVQDPAVCLLAAAVCPALELHGSTQMTVANALAAEFAAGLGVSRVVVPRELSVHEISLFAAGTAMDLEVFVHGALCVSWSGQCLTSEAWGGRSANRGECAQSCRMPYELVVDGKVRDLGEVKYLLSPKDLAGAAAVPELLAHGVGCLKIEGRQKGPHYVATATAGYRRWVDALVDGSDRKAAERQLSQDLLAMSLSYTRGFSDGFLAGSDHQTLVEGRFPKHRGVYVGTVVRVTGDRVVVRPDATGRPWTGALALATRPGAPAGDVSAPLPTEVVAAPLQLRPGMGVVFDAGEPEDKNEPGGPVFEVETRPGELVLTFGKPGPDLSRVRMGQRVFCTSDPTAAAATEKLQRLPEPEGRNAVQLAVRGAAGAPLTVTATCGACTATASTASALQPARGAGLDAALLTDKLGAFGGTPFRLLAIDCSALPFDLYVPASELKELRRRLVADLLPQLERGPLRAVESTPALPRVRAALATAVAPAPAGEIQLVPLLRSDAQLDAAIAAGVQEVELDWMEFVGLGVAFARARKHGLRVGVATPRVGKPGEDAIDERIWKLEPDAILVRHWGAMVRYLRARGAARTPALHGDFSLNVTNSLTARHLLRLGLDTVTASHDLDESQLFALLAAMPGERLAVTAHHRISTFHTEHCLYSHLLSNGRDFRSCGRPCERHQLAVRDLQGREHPVIVDVGCRNTVFHHAPQQSAALVSRLLSGGVRRFRVEFVRETGVEVGRVLAAWRERLAGRIDAAEVGKRTHAASHFGVSSAPMQLLSE